MDRGSNHPVRTRVLTWLLLVALGIPALAQESQGILNGLVLDPAGQPAEGFRLIFKTEYGTEEYTSDPSDALGKYSINLPAGKSYVLVAAVAPDGTRMKVPPLPALPVEQGARRVDIRFGEPEEGQGAAGAAGGEAGSGAAAAKSGVNWWQVGAAAGAVVVVLIIATQDGDDEQPASPSK